MMDSDGQGRRAFLVGTGLAVAGLSGCLSGGSGQNGTPTGEGTATATETTNGTQTAQRSAAETETDAAADAFAEHDWFQPWGETFDSFERFDAEWETFAGTAKASDDGFDDGQSVTLDSDGGNRARIMREFPTPQNFSDQGFSLAVKLHSTTEPLVGIGLVLEDSAGNRRFHEGAIMPNATDRWVRLDMGVKSDDGLDPSSVTGLWVDHWAGDGEAIFSVDDLRTVPKPDVGYVVLSFSNDKPADFGAAVDVCEEYGFTGACLPNLATIGEGPTQSAKGFRKMVDAGWDVGGHGLEHEPLSDFSGEEQHRRLATNARRLREMGVADDLLHFRTPLGRYDSETLDVVLDSFDTCIVGAGATSGVNARVTDPRTIGFRATKSLEATKEYIDETAQYRQLLGLATPVDDVGRDHVEAIVEHVHEHVEAGRLQVITMSDLYEMSLSG